MATSTERGYPRKRAQTRGRLRRAGMAVIAAKGPDGATVGEIATLAGVAQGTFYNHFTALGELIDEIAEELGSVVEIAQEALEAIESDPATRVAIGVLQLLEMAASDETAASAFVALVSARPSFRGRVRAIVARAIADGVASGRFEVEAGPAVTNAVLGATLQSMRSMILGETDGSTATAVAHLVLRILGVADDEAAEVVQRARATLTAPAAG